MDMGINQMGMGLNQMDMGLSQMGDGVLATMGYGYQPKGGLNFARQGV